MRRLLVGATIYQIWQEKNIRSFQNKKRTEEVIIQVIVECLRTKLMSLTVKDSIVVREMEERWNMEMMRNATKEKKG